MRREIGSDPERHLRERDLPRRHRRAAADRVKVTVNDESIHVDYAGLADQVPYAINSPYCYTYAYTVYPLKCLCSPDTPNNQGTFDAITVSAPRGLDPEPDLSGADIGADAQRTSAARGAVRRAGRGDARRVIAELVGAAADHSRQRLSR